MIESGLILNITCLVLADLADCYHGHFASDFGFVCLPLAVLDDLPYFVNGIEWSDVI